MLLRLGHGMATGGCNAAATGSSSAYLDSILNSACCDLDATIEASYDGTGQTWANLIASPADGAAQSDWDSWLGKTSTATTDDPTFSGTAGDSAARFTFDGGDLFANKAIPPLLRDAHKSSGGSVSSFAVTFKTGSASTEFFSPNTTYCMLVSFDFENQTYSVWLNAATTTATGAITRGTTTTDAAKAMFIGRSNDFGSLSSGAEMYSFAAFNELLDNTKAAAIIAHLEARHGRDYTP